MDDFLPLALAVAGGIGLPAGLRQWIWLFSMAAASHFSLLRERYALPSAFTTLILGD